VGVTYGSCRVLRAKMSKPDVCGPSNYRHEPQVVSDAPPFSRKDCLFKTTYDLCHKIVFFRFGIIWELVDNMEAVRVPYDCKHEFLLWISCLGFVITSSLDRVHMQRGDVSKENHDSSLVTR
jgi:hypothetical protein